MAVFKCKMCGGDLVIEPGMTVAECEYCGSKQTVPQADNEKKINLCNRANRLRIACEFDKAAAIYEQIIAEFPEEAEAYWGLCLANYGIEYVDDPATGSKIPTCHRASSEKMRKDENYELAIENADMAARIVYEDQAKEIDRIMSDILRISRDEKPYDIFICYKETDNYGARTPDSVLAQDIYDALTEKGHRVFFSRITLEDKLGTQYEPYIFSALNSAKIMLVVGTDYEYMNAVWVKNEWSRFIKLMAKDKSKVLIPCYKDMDPYDMPDELKPYQSQDCGKLGFMQDLTRGIEKILGVKKAEASDNNKAATPAGGTAATATVTSLLKRAFMFLEDGNWEDADTYCEKVLDVDPENTEAYLGKLMAELKVRNRKQLADCTKPFDGRDNYAKVLRFGDEALEKELRGYITHINDRNKKAYLKSIYDNAMHKYSAEEYNRAAGLFASIPGYMDSDELLKQCLEMAEKQRAVYNQLIEALKNVAEKQRAEAEEVYNQLIEALKNNGKTETTESHLEDAENKKQELERSLDEQLRKFETDKNTFRSKTSSLNRKRNELQSLDLKKQEIDRKISDLEKQISSLGIFAISKKKELSREIENLSAEKLKLSGDIDELQKEVASLMATLEALGSEAEINNRTEALKQDFKDKIQTVDNEIECLKKKLEEEETSGKRRFSFSEIVGEITTKKYISKYIKSDSQKVNTLKRYSDLPFELCNLFDLPFFFGAYWQGKIGEVAPIEWIALAKENGKALLISKYALDCQKYNSTHTNVTWEKCSLRTWMNGTFLNNAFSTDEQAKIATTTVSADKNPQYSYCTNPGNATTDKVFLLSITEAEKHFTTDESRKCAPTAYAKVRGAYTSDSDKTASGEAACWWWLRSPGFSQNDAAIVYRDGSVHYDGHDVNNVLVCVRPALWINLDS